MSRVESVIGDNYARVRERIEGACRRAGRPFSEVRLVAVTKGALLPWIEALVALGLNELGESRPQQLAERAPLFGEAVHWHLVGHLQRNKVRKVLPLITLVHSVDSVPLLKRIGGVGSELGLRPRVLLEVNVSGEVSKNGFRPDDLAANWSTIAGCSQVHVVGLMTMAPHAERAETARPVFARLRALRDRLAATSPAEVTLPELSMGMSGDFEVAVEEGATMLRIGSSLLEGLSEESSHDA